MRVPPKPSRVVAVLGTAALLLLGSALAPTTAIAQGPEPGRGLPPGGPGQQQPGGFPGASQPPGGSGSGPPGGAAPGAQEGEAPGAAPIDLDAVPTDTTPLARYIPSGSMATFLEFVGLNAAEGAWSGSSARGILNDSSLGEMFREVLSQWVEAAPDAPFGVMNGPEVAAVAEHLARHGLIIASPMDAERQADEVILVLRNAAHREVRPLFGKLIGTIAEEGTRPEVASKGERQVVMMNGTARGLAWVREWSWWIEGEDLVFVFNGPEAIDQVIAVLDGAEPSGEEDTIRQQLMAGDGTFQAFAFGTWALDRPGSSPNERALVEQNGLTRADLRWGFDGEESMTVVELAAPSPRQGMLASFDGPGLSMGELPPIHPEVGSLTVLSASPAGLYDALKGFADQASPPLAAALSSFEESVEARARYNLRDDFLTELGPQMAFYTLPKADRPQQRQGRNPNGPLSGLLSVLGGLGLPQFVIAIEVENASAFKGKLGGMILAINQQIASLMPPPPEPNAGGQNNRGGPPGSGNPPGSGDPRGSGGPPGGSGGSPQRDAEPPEPPKFDLNLDNPRTYILNLPDGLFALTGYRPTITLGNAHLIIASNPVDAVKCRNLEQAMPNDRWSPPGELAGQLPGNLSMFMINDPTQTLPQAIASLPATITEAMAPPPEAPAAPGAPGAPGAPTFSGGLEGGGGPGSLGSSRGESDDPRSGSGRGDSSMIGSGAPGMVDSGGPGMIGSGGPGMVGSGGPGQSASAAVIQIPQAMIPTPDALRRFLGSAVYSVSADEATIRIEARETLPGQWVLGMINGLPGFVLPTPARN